MPDVVGIIHAAPEAQDRPDVPGERPRVSEALQLHPTPRAECCDGLVVDEAAGPGAVETGQDRPLLADGDALVERPELIEGLSGAEHAGRHCLGPRQGSRRTAFQKAHQHRAPPAAVQRAEPSDPRLVSLRVDQLCDPDERSGRQPGVGVEEDQYPAARQPRSEVPRPGRAEVRAGRHPHAVFGRLPGQGVGRAVVTRVVDHDDLHRPRPRLAVSVACPEDRPHGRSNRAPPRSLRG